MLWFIEREEPLDLAWVATRLPCPMCRSAKDVLLLPQRRRGNSLSKRTPEPERIYSAEQLGAAIWHGLRKVAKDAKKDAARKDFAAALQSRREPTNAFTPEERRRLFPPLALVWVHPRR